MKEEEEEEAENLDGETTEEKEEWRGRIESGLKGCEWLA